LARYWSARFHLSGASEKTGHGGHDIDIIRFDFQGLLVHGKRLVRIARRIVKAGGNHVWFDLIRFDVDRLEIGAFRFWSFFSSERKNCRK
jgi:hypothetical protein